MNFVKGRKTLKVILLLVTLCSASYVQAGISNWASPFVSPGTKIETLIVTTNYADSRLLAELIQTNTKQPILLLPAVEGGKIYFIPPKGKEKAMSIPESELTNFVNFVAPKQVILLGNTKYVPEKYADQISDSQTVCRIESKYWDNIANVTASFLNIPNLSSDYKKLYTNMMRDVHYVRSDSNPSSVISDNSGNTGSLPGLSPADGTLIDASK